MFPLFAAGLLFVALFAGALFGDAASALFVFVAVSLFLLFTRRWISRLADEVRDGGSFLFVRRGEIEDKVYLNDIERIDYELHFPPPRVCIIRRSPGPFGRKIEFLGDEWAFRLISEPKLVRELRERVERSRGAGA